MTGFIAILRRFVPPYKKYLFLNIFFNLLSAFLTPLLVRTYYPYP